MASIVHPFNNNWNISRGPRSNAHEHASIVHPFNNNWNSFNILDCSKPLELQSYILSTTTETCRLIAATSSEEASIVHPFNNNWNTELPWWHCPPCQASIVHPFNNNWNVCQSRSDPVLLYPLQSYILSTTTETSGHLTPIAFSIASIVHPFNNNWNSR